MNPESLDHLLRDYSRQTLPDAPARLEEGVWREISRRRSLSPLSPGWLASLGWLDLFARPVLAIPALSLALVLGILPVYLTQRADQQRAVRQSLHLEVFNSSAPGLPATLLSQPGQQNSLP